MQGDYQRLLLNYLSIAFARRQMDRVDGHSVDISDDSRAEVVCTQIYH